MPAYATQSAPKQAQGNPQQQKQPKQETPKGLAALPQGAGVAALVVMLALALPIGNFRALQNATPQAFIRQGDVKSIVEDRISAAQNAVTVAQRGSVSQTTLDDVSSAIKAMQSAKTARDISRADQQLTVAVSQLVDDANLTSAEDERMLTRAADTFAEQVARPGFSPRQEGVSDTHRPENSHPDSLLLFEIPLLFRHDRTSLMRAKSASACCAGAPGAEHLLLPWGYSCGRGNP